MPWMNIIMNILSAAGVLFTDAKKVDEKVTEAREKIQKFLGASRPEEIIFTRTPLKD